MANVEIVSVIQRLVNAENTRNAAAADALLAADFVAITRVRGVEQDRAALLGEIGHPPGQPVERRLEPETWVRQSGDLAVVRSVVRTIDGSTPPVTARFRNVHVLTREGGEWKCLSWQVTKLA
jgi:hypothetical protein